jgi:6-phosphogluconolactonase
MARAAMTAHLIEHASRAEQAQALASAVAADLQSVLQARGVARLAVPGGTTPGPFLTLLGAAPVDWDRIAVTLTDERWLPTSSDRSNQRLLGETLFAGPAAAAEFVPLYGATHDPADSIDAIHASLKRIALPLDVIVLGMGEDMHTASLFPGADRLAAALSDDAPPAMALRAPGAGEARVTLTAPVIRGAGKAYLLIQGAAKRAALDKAAGARIEDAPVRVVLDRTGPTQVFYAD